MKKSHNKPARGSAKEAKAIQATKKMLADNWMFHASKEEIENCICCEYDGKGFSCCGAPCPTHNKMTKKQLKRVAVERKIHMKIFLDKIKSGRISEEIPF